MADSPRTLAFGAVGESAATLQDAGRTWSRLERRGGAPGGAAPLRHWGARALARRAADPRKVRQGASQAPGASRRSISLACKGEGKRGKGDARRPKIQRPGRHSVAYP